MKQQKVKRFITASILATCFWIIFFYFSSIVFSATLVGILITILFVEWKNIFKCHSTWFWLMMPVYPILPFALIIYMNQTPQYHNLVYYLFLTVFSFDASAYFTGIFLGRTKIAPTISPGKTVEGCIGGYLGSQTLFLWAAWEQGLQLSWYFSILFVMITCTIAFFGDIFESYLKRCAGIKDSGSTLPGHGGFLDRFDAVMMVAFFFFLFKDTLAPIFTATA